MALRSGLAGGDFQDPDRLLENAAALGTAEPNEAIAANPSSLGGGRQRTFLDDGPDGLVAEATDESTVGIDDILKRRATVGTASPVDRSVRTPEEVVATRCRDGPPPPPRPQPAPQRVGARWPPKDEDGAVLSSLDLVYDWLRNEVAERNSGWAKALVHRGDGQESLWQARQDPLPNRNLTDILDRLHGTPRRWQAAHVFCAEGSDEWHSWQFMFPWHSWQFIFPSVI